MCCVPYKCTIYSQMKISNRNVVIDHLANELIRLESCFTTYVSFKNRIAMDNVHEDEATKKSFLESSSKSLSLILCLMIDIIEHRYTITTAFLNYTFADAIYSANYAFSHQYHATPHDK